MFILEDLGGDRDTALIVLAEARRLAPCLDNLDGDSFDTAKAILRRTVKRSAELASTLKTKTAGDWSGTKFSPAEAGPAFLAEDRAALQALCGISASRGVGPLGSFPAPTPTFRP